MQKGQSEQVSNVIYNIHTVSYSVQSLCRQFILDDLSRLNDNFSIYLVPNSQFSYFLAFKVRITLSRFFRNLDHPSMTVMSEQ